MLCMCVSQRNMAGKDQICMHEGCHAWDGSRKEGGGGGEGDLD